MLSKKRYRKVCSSLAVLTGYACTAIITTWPLLTRMTDRLPGDSTDTLVHYWNGWWVQKALSMGQSPFYTTYLFYPNGISLVTHNIAWLSVLPWLLLEPLFGGILAYNVILLIHLTLCGCAACLLTYKMTADPRAAFLAGLIYQAWPFRLCQLDHPNMLSTEWVPLFFLFLIYTIRKGRWRDGVLTGLFFALVGYTRWQQLIPVTLMGLIYFVFAAPHWLPKGRRHILSRLSLAGGIAIAALLPAFLLLLGHLGEGISAERLLYTEDEERWQTDALAYVTPSGLHPVLGDWTGPLYDRYYRDRLAPRSNPSYIGLVVLLLMLVGIRSERWKSLPWVSMAVLLVSLAQGPLARFNGRFYPKVPTLYRLLSPLIFVRLIRTPDRFNMFLALPASVLAAYGVARWLARRRERRQWTTALVPSVLGLVILFEYLITPVPTYRPAASVTPFYAEIAGEAGDFAVLDVPLDTLQSKEYMFGQVIHQRPIVLGAVSRGSDRLYAYIDSNPWLRALRQSDEMPYTLSDVGRQLTALAKDGIRYIIVHKTWAGADRVAHWQRYLLTRPRYQDKLVAVYVTTPKAGRDFELIEELVPGLGPIRVLLSSDCLNPDDVLEVAIGWGSTRALDRDLDMTMLLVDGAGDAQHAERFPLSTTWPTSQWPADAVAWEYYTLRPSQSVPLGEYRFELALQDAETGQSYGKPVSIRPVILQSETCNLATLPEAEDVNAVFGDRLRLLEYQAHQREGRLDLTLYWRSQRWMDTDYKIFVHVADPVTGIPVAQNDAMPHHGAYPTTLWWPGDVVEDRVSVPLHGVPGGSYAIALGVYEPATGERLPLENNQGQVIADSRLLLEETVELE